MGFLSELGIDAEEIEAAAGFEEPDAGFYAFEISESAIIEGTSKDEDVVKYRITYALFDENETPAGSKSEWWTLFEVAGEEPGEDAQRSRGYLKRRLLDLGVTTPLNDLEHDEVEGITGTLRLVSKGDYTNVRNVKGTPKAAPVKTTASRAAAGRAPAGTTKSNPFKKTAS
jgi:hypothetical protein